MASSIGRIYRFTRNSALILFALAVLAVVADPGARRRPPAPITAREPSPVPRVDPLDRIDLARKQRIYQDAIAARDRAAWVADRIHNPQAEPTANRQVAQERLTIYRGGIIDAYRLRDGDLPRIESEGDTAGWPRPAAPTFSYSDAARQMGLHVVLDRQEGLFHRPSCPALAATGHPADRLRYDDAFYQPDARPCPACRP